MKKLQAIVILLMCTIGFFSTTATGKIITLWIFGDSTVKDYTNYQDSCSSLLKISGWGEFMDDYLSADSLSKVSNIITADSYSYSKQSQWRTCSPHFYQWKRQHSS